jgi:hypothetical protein
MMRSFVIVLGSLLTNTALGVTCKQPPPPEIPADAPIAERVEKKLSRDVARFISDSAKYVGCLHAEGVDPAIAQKENEALRDVASLIELYETRIGHSDLLIAEVAKIGGPTSQAVLDRRIAAAQAALESDAIQTLNAAIAHINARRYDEARAAVGELDLDRLTPFERSKAEQVLYTIANGEEDFEKAREHVRRSIAAGGLSAYDTFRAKLALTNLDVMLRLRNTSFAGATDPSAQQ